jgi:hypothetical protein
VGTLTSVVQFADLAVLGTGRVTKGLILGTVKYPGGKKLIVEGTAQINSGSFVRVRAGSVISTKGSFEDVRVTGTATLRRPVLGSSYISRLGIGTAAKSQGLTIRGPTGADAVRVYIGTETYTRIQSDGNLLIGRAAEIQNVMSIGGTASILGGAYGLRLAPGQAITVGTLSNGAQFADLTVLGTGRVTKGLILGTVKYPGGKQLIVEGSAQINSAYIRRITGTYKTLVQGGSAKPGSAGYITFGRAFAAAPSAVLTQKTAWVPSVAYGPRIKKILAGSMQCMGSPLGYAWWQAVGSAF